MNTFSKKIDIVSLNSLKEKIKDKVNVDLKSDDFEIGKKLGCGTFGDIYSCKQNGKNDTLALKCIPLESCKKKQITREIENLSNLKHPNITELFGMFFDKDNVYMVLEYCELGDLFELIQQNGPLSEKEMSNYTYDIAKALQYCTEKKIYHRDIKPENILIGKNKIAKLCDFGFSIHISDDESPLRTSSYGTTDYVAPEVLHNNYDGRIDIWSFGIVIYEVIHGLPPFYNASYAKTFKNIETCNITYPKKFSPLLVDLLKKMIVLAPELRITATDILKHGWILKLNKRK